MAPSCTSTRAARVRAGDGRADYSARLICHGAPIEIGAPFFREAGSGKRRGKRNDRESSRPAHRGASRFPLPAIFPAMRNRIGPSEPPGGIVALRGRGPAKRSRRHLLSLHDHDPGHRGLDRRQGGRALPHRGGLRRHAPARPRRHACRQRHRAGHTQGDPLHLRRQSHPHPFPRTRLAWRDRRLFRHAERWAHHRHQRARTARRVRR